MKHIASLLLLTGLHFLPLHAQHRVLNTIYFEKNKCYVQQKYTPLLKQLATLANADTCTIVKIIGYADTTGQAKHNYALSQQRAATVYQALKNYGVTDSAKIRLDWMGDVNETYDLHLTGAHTQQRCVDIVVMFKYKGE